MSSNIKCQFLKKEEQTPEFKQLLRQLCGQGFGADTFWDNLKFDLVVVATCNEAQVGFTLITKGFRIQENNTIVQNADDSWYIELMCGPGTGQPQMTFIKEAAKAQGVQWLSLSALYHKVTYYYEKHDFLIGNTDHGRFDKIVNRMVTLRKKQIEATQSGRDAGRYDYWLRQAFANLAILGACTAFLLGEKKRTRSRSKKSWFEYAQDGVYMTFKIESDDKREAKKPRLADPSL